MNDRITITFDKGAAKYVWLMLKDLIKNPNCPFCGRRVKRDHFGGAFHYEGKPRLVHSELSCLIALSDYIKTAPITPWEERL